MNSSPDDWTDITKLPPEHGTYSVKLPDGTATWAVWDGKIWFGSGRTYEPVAWRKQTGRLSSLGWIVGGGDGGNET